MSKVQLSFLVLLVPTFLYTQNLDTAAVYQTIRKADRYQGNNALDSASMLYEQTIASIEKDMGNDQDSVLWSRYIGCYEKLSFVKMRTGKNMTHPDASGTEGDALFDKALKLTETRFVGNKSKYIDVYDRLAASFSRFDMKKTLELDKKILDLAKEFNMSAIKIAGKYMNIGTDYKSLGEYQKALDYLKQTESVYIKEQDTSGSLYMQLCVNFSAIYDNMNEREKAIFYANEGIQFYEMLSKPSKSVETDANRLYQNIAHNYYRTKFYDLAFINASKALYNKRKQVTEKTTILDLKSLNLGLTYQLIGRIQVSKCNFAEADTAFRMAIEINRKVGVSTIIDYNELSNCYRLKGDFIKSLHYSDTALSFFIKNKDLNPPFNISLNIQEGAAFIEVLIQCADVYKLGYDQTGKREYLTKAIGFIEEALKNIDIIKQKSNGTVAREVWQEKTLPVYERYLRLSEKQYDTDKNTMILHDFFSILEQSKSVSLLEAVNANDIGFPNIPKELLDEEKKLTLDITTLEKNIYDQDRKSAAKDTLAHKKYNQELFARKQEKEAWLSKMEKDYNAYFQLKHNRKTISLKELQAQLPPKQSIIEYFVGDSSVFIFCINKYNVQLKKVKKDFPLEGWIDSFRVNLKSNVGAPDMTDKGYKLYQKLVAPILSFFPSRQEKNEPNRVIIIPDGVLGYLPFEALITQLPTDPTRFANHKYLINDFIISYNFSATLHSRLNQKMNKPDWRYKMVGFAPFYFKPVKEDTSNAIVARGGMDSLNNSGEELRYVRKNTEGVAYYGKDATSTRFFEMAKDSRIVHLATHASANDKFMGYSFLAFASPEKGVDSVFVKDIYNMSIPADMVVLSACETGLGKLRRGEGIISLSRSFIYAGARSLVYSLWVADDKSSKDLMKLFYDNLKSGMPKDEALWQAKIVYLDKTKNNTTKGVNHAGCNPYYWAQFVPMGDMEVLKM
jgi:CHAT domain-containing protein